MILSAIKNGLKTTFNSLISNTVVEHNMKYVMKKICEGGNKSGLYAPMKMLMEKGKENNDSKLKLIHDDGETIDDEIILKAMIEKFWVIYLA